MQSTITVEQRQAIAAAAPWAAARAAYESAAWAAARAETEAAAWETFDPCGLLERLIEERQGKQ